MIGICCCIIETNKNYIDNEENDSDVEDKKDKINVYLRVRKCEWKKRFWSIIRYIWLFEIASEVEIW